MNVHSDSTPPEEAKSRFLGKLITCLIIASTASIVWAQTTQSVEEQIRSLPEIARQEVVSGYALGSGLMYGKFVKFRNPPQIFLSCPKQGCDIAVLGALADAQLRVPRGFGQRVSDPESADIEIYVGTDQKKFEKRDRAVDARLHFDAHITAKSFFHPTEQTPCRTVVYFDKKKVIGKSLIFIDSEESVQTQSLCIVFEASRATGVFSLPPPLFYAKVGPTSFRDRLALASIPLFLHASSFIKPGETVERVLSMLREKYDLK